MQYNMYKNNTECDMASCHKVMQCTARYCNIPYCGILQYKMI